MLSFESAGFFIKTNITTLKVQKTTRASKTKRVQKTTKVSETGRQQESRRKRQKQCCRAGDGAETFGQSQR
jgi:hypothetical protein